MGNCTSSAAAAGDTYIEHVFHTRWAFEGVELGRGGSGKVVLARHRKRHKELVAVKIIQKGRLSKDDCERIKKEVDIMRQLQHPNIARFIDFFDEKDHMYVVMEYLEGGCLFDRIVKKKVYTELFARDLIYVFLIALKHCHDKGIIHRDLKPENLILSSIQSDIDVKIADFGLSIEDDESTKEERQIACGTPLYIAPEMIRAATGKYPGLTYGKEIDLWACGCLAFTLLAGYPPFDVDMNDPKNSKLFRDILKGNYEAPKRVSEDAIDLINGLLCVDPAKRLTVDQALAHRWVTAAGDTLAARNLEANLKKFRAFQGRKKFRAGVNALIATRRFQKVIESLKETKQKRDSQIMLEQQQLEQLKNWENGSGEDDNGNASMSDKIDVPESGKDVWNDSAPVVDTDQVQLLEEDCAS
jgi:serine/threonine protein kinase